MMGIGWWVAIFYVVGFLATLVLMVWYVVFHEDGGSSEFVPMCVLFAFIWPIGLPVGLVMAATTELVRFIRRRQ